MHLLLFKMEGTCNECVFPLTKEETESEIKSESTCPICPTHNSLTYAAREGKLSCVKELIIAGANVNAVCECHGFGALHSAAWSGHVDCLREIIASLSDVNITNRNGGTALRIAASRGHTECLKELIGAGADINKEDKDGRTALMYAANQGCIECLKELIAAGADINCPRLLPLLPRFHGR